MSTKDHTIPGVKSYLYNGEKISISPFFIYEVSLYRISKNRANVISTKFYRSNKELIVKDVEVIRYFKGFTIERFITLLSAPLEFIEEKDLKEYVKSNRTRKKKPNSK